MNQIMRFLIVIIFCSLSAHAFARISSLSCKEDALREAAKFLAFYRENDPRIVIDKNVKPLPQRQNPAKRGQHFDVVEVWGGIYKGEYRMRFIFYKDCTLMGEEMLEYAAL